MCTTNDKPFLTYEQQLQKLAAKGLTINDYDKAMDLLKKHSYFALISGYKSPFNVSCISKELLTQFSHLLLSILPFHATLCNDVM